MQWRFKHSMLDKVLGDFGRVILPAYKLQTGNVPHQNPTSIKILAPAPSWLAFAHRVLLAGIILDEYLMRRPDLSEAGSEEAWRGMILSLSLQALILDPATSESAEAIKELGWETFLQEDEWSESFLANYILMRAPDHGLACSLLDTPELELAYWVFLEFQFMDFEAGWPSFTQKINEILATLFPETDMQLESVGLIHNPYHLLSGKFLSFIKNYLIQSGRRPLMQKDQQWLYLGEPISKSEWEEILHKAGQESKAVDILALTKINRQKCDFGFIGSLKFTPEILLQIIRNKREDLLKFSPNSKDKIPEFQQFITFFHAIVSHYKLPLEILVENHKIRLSPRPSLNREDELFFDNFCLIKIQWLRRKDAKPWEKDFLAWYKKDISLETPLELEEGKTLASWKEVRDFLQDNVAANQQKFLYLTLLALIKAAEHRRQGLDGSKDYLAEIPAVVEAGAGVLPEAGKFARTYGMRTPTDVKAPLATYAGEIPEKGQMCTFTGQTARKQYREAGYFSLNPKGPSNRSPSYLGNTFHHVSALYDKELQTLKSVFSDKLKADHALFYRMESFHLPMHEEMLRALFGNSEQQKNHLPGWQLFPNVRMLEGYSLGFADMAPAKNISRIEKIFFLVRDHVKLLHEYGIKSNISAGLQASRQSEFDFYFENAPTSFRKLGWHKISRKQAGIKLREMDLIFRVGQMSRSLGMSIRLTAQSRMQLFKFYYETNDTHRRSIFFHLKEVVEQNPTAFHALEKWDPLVIKLAPLQLNTILNQPEVRFLKTLFLTVQKGLRKSLPSLVMFDLLQTELQACLEKEGAQPEKDSLTRFIASFWKLIQEKDIAVQSLPKKRLMSYIYQIGFCLRLHTYYLNKRKKTSLPETMPALKNEHDYHDQEVVIKTTA
ncbi:MAG: hypothetical protein AAFR61_31310 [Bacteroidota bacterium]